MADPVSLALGIAGVAAPVFKSSIAAINFVLDIRNVPKDQGYLVLSLRLEEQRLYTWGEHVGLVTYDEFSATDADEEAGVALEVQTSSKVFGAHRGLVLDLLVQVSVLFDDFRKQQLRHKRLGQITSPDEKRRADTLLDTVSSEAKMRFLKEAFESVKSRSMGGWRRVRWATFDMAEFKELIRRFSSLNDSITGLLDSKLQRDIANTTQDIYREVLQMATKQEQFKDIIDATRFGQQAHGSQDKSLKTLMQLASFKAFYRDVDDEDLPVMHDDGSFSIDRPNMKIPVSHIQLEEAVGKVSWRPYYGSRTKAWYCPSGTFTCHLCREVWIEWKHGADDRDPGYEDDAILRPKHVATGRANTLARLLNQEDKPKEFRVPYCFGYFDMSEDLDAHPKAFPGWVDGVGFVCAMPRGTEAGARPQSLRQLLGDPGVAKPEITDRIALARALASSLQFLHTVNWFGKSVRSDNVLIFVKDGSQRIDFNNPMQSGLDYVHRLESASRIL